MRLKNIQKDLGHKRPNPNEARSKISCIPDAGAAPRVLLDGWLFFLFFFAKLVL